MLGSPEPWMYKNHEIKQSGSKKLSRTKSVKEASHGFINNSKNFRFEDQDQVRELQKDYMVLKLKKFDEDFPGNPENNENKITKFSETSTETRTKIDSKATLDLEEDTNIYSKDIEVTI